MKTFTIKSFLLILCLNIHCGDAISKSGIIPKTCQLLSDGEVFWGPKITRKQCPLTPVCMEGFKLAKTIINEKRYCCCQLKKITQCPNCEMTYAYKMPFWYWFNVQISRTNGPKDGFCKPERVKRILMEEGKADKCCCEPRNSPFVPKDMKEYKKP